MAADASCPVNALLRKVTLKPLPTLTDAPLWLCYYQYPAFSAGKGFKDTVGGNEGAK